MSETTYLSAELSDKGDINLFKELFKYILRQKTTFVLVIVAMLLADIFGVLPPYFFKLGLDESVPAGDLNGLYKNALWLALSLAGGFVFSVVFGYLSQRIGQRLVHDLRMDITRKIFSLNSSYFDQNPVGNILTYLTNDLESIKQFISDGVAGIVGDLMKVIFILGFMFWLNPILALLAIVSVPLFGIATYLFRLSLRLGYRGIRKSSATMNTTLVEAITGIKEITIFNHVDKTLRDFEVSNQNYLRSFLKVVFAYSLYFPLIEIVSFISMVAVLYGAHNYINVKVTAGEIFSFFFYINMFFRPLRDLAEQFNTFQSAMSGAERIFYFLDTPRDFSDEGGSITDYRARGAIAFQKVEFTYPLHPRRFKQDESIAGANNKNNGPVLKNISFRIKPGEKIAIVGSTGAGKTTLISLLNRLYEVSKGKITIDGKDIRDFSFKCLRENITTIPQDIFLFTGSFYDNIALQKPVAKGHIEEVAKKIRLHDFISQREKQYRENVLEEGKSLSTGQKQLLSFARAFVKDAPIVILDEATSNIDSHSEEIIQKALYKVLEGKTAIIIAHRLSTIRNADRILVMHQGKLVENGTHKELMGKRSGIYRNLYQIQSIELSK